MRRNRDTVPGSEFQCHLQHASRIQWFGQPHEHEMQPARLQGHHAAGRDFDTIFHRPHLHDPVIVGHLMDLGLFCEAGRNASEPVGRVTMVMKAQISARRHHARHRSTKLDFACFHLEMATGIGAADNQSDKHDKSRKY